MKFQRIINASIKYSLLFILTFCCCLSATYCQTRKSLESKRKKLLKEIQSTSNLLNQTSKNRMATLDRYMALQQQIKMREELIETLNAELDFAIKSLERTSNVVFSLEEDLDRLEKEYGILARSALRQKMSNSNLLFIFSSRDFNQAFQRWQYLRQFNNYRKKQGQLILETQASLKEKVALLEERKQEKEALLLSHQEQKSLLAEELNDKSLLLESLQEDEERLKRELTEHRNAHDKLNNAIEAVIKKEMLANRKRERSRNEALNKTGKPKSKPLRSPETRLSSSGFSTNKGKLPWPVVNGVIVKHFGKQPHPTLKRVEITNNGIDIQTHANAKVRAVFKGIVVGKQFIPGYDNMLIVKHGDYYTVYSNLKEVLVKKDEVVKTRQVIGIASQKGNISQVHFEVWKDKERLNPARWIARN